MGDFLLGVIASIVAAAAIALVVRLTAFGRIGFNRMWRERRMLRRMGVAGVSNFYASRVDYQAHRGAPGLADYLATAKTSIKVAAYWMAYGNEAEGASEAIADLAQNRALDIDIAIIDPDSPHVELLSEYLGVEMKELQIRMRSSIANLLRARARLSDDAKERFRVRTYHNLPVASVILLDTGAEDGRVQIDIKPYRAPRDRSFGFELSGPDGPLYQTVRDAWADLVDSAPEADPKLYLQEEAGS